MENKRDDRKKKIREIAGGILCIAVLLFIVMQIMLPETGIGGMVNEGSMAVLFFGVGAVCAYAAIKKRKEDKSALVLGLCLAVLACVPGWLDLWEGRSRSYRRTKNDPSDIGYNRGTQRIIRVNFSSLLFMRQRGRRKAVSAGSIGWKYRQMSFMSWKIYMKSLYDVIREQSGFWNFCNS